MVQSLMAYGPNVAIDHARYAQDAVSVLVVRLTGKSFEPSLAMEVPLHALGRVFERGATTPVEVKAALHQAAEHFLAVDRGAMERAAETGESVSMPSGNGLLLGEVIEAELPDPSTVIGNPLRLFFRARTWIGAESAMADQVPPSPASDAAESVLCCRRAR